MNSGFIQTMLEQMACVMEKNRERLIELDSVVGDGDLGITMSEGFRAAADAVAKLDETDIGKLLYLAGKTMSTAVPSTMGTLMASGWMSAGKQLRGKTELLPDDLAVLFSAYATGVADRGKAQEGEKTFLDGLLPAVRVMQTASGTIAETLQAAYAAAQAGYESTATMLAVHGRAATRGEASRSLLDPGAQVAVLMMQVLANTIK